VPIREVRQALLRFGCPGSSLLLAVSGGLDSVTLCHVLHELSEELGLKILIGHVNHGLRGADSDADEASVRALAGRLGLEFEAARLAPGSLRQGVSSRDRPTLQEAARELRYAWLDELAERRGVRHIATAHTLDDQAETVLLRLLRGTGPDGLGGIPEQSRDGRLVRPLLAVSRGSIERFAAERRLSWREDASNARLDYTRNRLRQRWLPGLVQDFNPQLLRAIGNLAEAQRRDSEWIEAEVQREIAARFAEDGSWLVIDAKDWGALHEALARRLVRAALERCGSGRLVTRVHLDRFVGFLAAGETGRVIEFPGGLMLRRTAGGYRLGPRQSGRSR
jgi:tRNA(Ile)-lysidine synthase